MSPSGRTGAAGARPRPAAPTSSAVVVVNWNGAAVLAACLESLARELPSSVPVVLVDNASTDGSVERAEQSYPGLVVVRRRSNDGFAAAVNEGIRATDAEVVVLINNDAVAEPGWLAALTAPFSAPDGADVGAVTGRVLLDGSFVEAAPPGRPDDLVDPAGRRWRRVADGGAVAGATRRVNSTGNEVTRTGNGRDRDWLSATDRPPAAADVFGFNGGCAALRRHALDDVGLMEESLFLYYEDTELSWRLRRRGWRVVHAHDAVTVHRHAASSGVRSETFVVHNVRNRLRVATRHAPWSVVARAYLRTTARLVAGPGRRWQARGLLGAVTALPTDLRARRDVDRAARCPRREVARLLVADGPATPVRAP